MAFIRLHMKNVLALRMYPLQAYFHYGSAFRCMAKEIETLSVSLYLSPRNATQRNAQP